MVLCRILPCVTGVKRGRVYPGAQARERQEREVRNAAPPLFSLALPFGTPDVQDSQILVITSGIENKTALHE